MKRFLWLLTLSLVATLCAVGLTACEDDNGANLLPDTPAHTHEYVETVINPTCTERGYTLHKCTCGNEYKDNYVQATGEHNYVNGVCSVCGAEGTEIIEPTSDEYFTFTLLSDDTYEIKAKNKNNMPAEVILPSTHDGKAVTSIGLCAFFECHGLTSITIPDSVTSVGNFAFDCSGLTSVTIGNSVTSIGYEAFYECSSLTSINVDENNKKYKSIDGNLYSKDGKTLIKYAIGKTANTFTIPASVTGIGDGAFEYCDSLTSITIPDNVTSIEYRAFFDCSSLTSITIGNSVTSIGNQVFLDCSSLKSINVDKNNAYYNSIDGNLYSKDGQTLIQYAIGKNNTEFVIPNSVISIGYFAFYNCSSLTSVTIPDSVKSIVEWAFCHCSNLTSITIPNSVISIGKYAFSGCSSLTSIIIPDSVTSIEQGAFYGCSSLTNIITPDSIASIEQSAFYECHGLTSITIPNRVTSIGDYAFYNCSKLTSITFKGTIAEWSSISKGNDWNYNLPAIVVHCADGDVAI